MEKIKWNYLRKCTIIKAIKKNHQVSFFESKFNKFLTNYCELANLKSFES